MKYIVKVTTAEKQFFLNCVCDTPEHAKHWVSLFEDGNKHDPTRKYTLYYVNPINVGPIDL